MDFSFHSSFVLLDIVPLGIVLLDVSPPLRISLTYAGIDHQRFGSIQMILYTKNFGDSELE